jgi:prepilin-type N-terminal cleavage/methylation domain-containing protein
MRSEKGFTLIEVLVATALMSIVGIGLLAALGGASKVLLRADIRETARDLAQAQMEYVQSLDYEEDDPEDPEDNPLFYDPLPDLDDKYPGFDVAVSASRIDRDGNPDNDDGLKKINIEISHNNKLVFTLEGMKLKK